MSCLAPFPTLPGAQQKMSRHKSSDCSLYAPRSQRLPLSAPEQSRVQIKPKQPAQTAVGEETNLRANRKKFICGLKHKRLRKLSRSCAPSKTQLQGYRKTNVLCSSEARLCRTRTAEAGFEPRRTAQLNFGRPYNGARRRPRIHIKHVNNNVAKPKYKRTQMRAPT